MRSCLLLLLCFPALFASTQAKLVINGGVINITNTATLVIDNPDNTAITQTGSGYIQSEGASNNVIWTIGTGNGNNYLVPFGNAANYLPISFNAASGSDATGKIIFSTYPTPTWKNSDYLPPGVTNINSGTTDNSANVIDRFWQINPQGYATKPSLSNLVFTYSDNEYAPPNTIAEASLISQRWNNVSQKWGDYLPPSTINTVNNTVTVSSIAGSQLFDWWTMVSSSSPLPVTLTYFNATVQDKKVITDWQTSFEQNTDHFEVWRSRDAQAFGFVGRLAAAGSSNALLNYSLTDGSPYTGISYYKLKSVDRNSAFKWSPIVTVNLDASALISVFPNPATNFIVLSSSQVVVNTKAKAAVYDERGILLQTFLIASTYQQINTSSLPAGTYRIVVSLNHQLQTLSFIKK